MIRIFLLAICISLGIGAQAEQTAAAAKEAQSDTTRPDESARPRQRDGAPDSPREGVRDTARAGGRGEMMLGRITEAVRELNLSAEQRTQIQQIFENSKQDIRKQLQELQKLSPPQRQQAMRDLIGGLRQKVEAVLDDEQKAKLEASLAAGRDGANGGREGANAGRFRDGATTRPTPDADRPRQRPDDGSRGVLPDGDAPRQRPDGGDRPRDGDRPRERGQEASRRGNNETAGNADAPGQGPLRIAATLKRLDDSLASINLSADQKKQAEAIVADGKKQISELREKLIAGEITVEQMREQAPAVFAGMRDQLAGVLTREQQLKLRDEIQSRVDRDGAGASESSPKPTAKPTTKPAIAPAVIMDDTPAMNGDADRAAEAALPRQTPLANNTGPKIGSPAPELNIERLDGRSNVLLSAYKNKPLVIVFGSYTSPSFRQRAAKLEELAKQYAVRANFLIVYTKEAHPTGGWEVERNKDEGVALAPHADLAARKQAAKDAKLALKLTPPIALDTMDDRVATAYGAGQNSAFILGRDGTVVAKQTWCDPFRLRAALDEAIAAKPSTMPAATAN